MTPGYGAPVVLWVIGVSNGWIRDGSVLTPLLAGVTSRESKQ